jgi:Uma2 family endonuclease
MNDAITKIPRTAMEVFHSLPEGTLCEVIENQLYMSPYPTPAHQKIIGDIYVQLREIIYAAQFGEILLSPIDVYLDETTNVVQPDIVIIAAAHLSIIQPDGIHGVPDIVIEVLSCNQDYDMVKKLSLYETKKIPEYFIIDPTDKTVWQYRLVNEKYQQTKSPKAGMFTTQLLQTSINF